MLPCLAAVAGLLSLVPSMQAFTPPYLDPATLSALLASQNERHNASLEAYRYNLAKRPRTVERARKVKILAAGLERQRSAPLSSDDGAVTTAEGTEAEGSSAGLGALGSLEAETEAEAEGERLRRRVVDLQRRQSSGGSGQQLGVVPLLDFYSQPLDVMVYGTVEIGTPSQSFDLLFDTGSADLWVYASGTGSNEPEWDSSASSTAITNPVIPWSIRYGKGSQTGFLNQDTVTLGGYTVNNTVFAAADSLNQAFNYYPISGLFGLGFGTISASGYAPWFERLIESGQLAQQYFSMYFVRAADVTQQAEGSLSGAQLCIGCVDSSKYTGDISWNPVLSEGFWSVAMDGILINGTMVQGTAVRAALDSGTTLIQLPTTAANAFFAKIPGSRTSASADGSYVVPCTTRFSSLAFSFNSVTYEIPPEDLLRAVSRDGTQCVLTITASDMQDIDGTPMAIVGEVFLKNAYSIYSYSHNGAPAVGLARSVIAGSWSTNDTSGTNRPGGLEFSQPVNQGSFSYSGAPLPTLTSNAQTSHARTASGTARPIITTAGLGGTGAVTGSWTSATSRGSGAASSAGGTSGATRTGTVPVVWTALAVMVAGGLGALGVAVI
ncbi:hypothetical protein JCM10908_001424 [Rhodotorula pacifica]|uniref:uncharacterized protein n=1 Tax=Rhodotorula pacifica TaxID=1495444 RepID=UPI00316C7A9B